MARIKLLDRENTPFHVKDIFDRVEKTVGVVPNQLNAVANSPDFIMPLAATMQVVHRSRSRRPNPTESAIARS
jgi:hypothetical protein